MRRGAPSLLLGALALLLGACGGDPEGSAEAASPTTSPAAALAAPPATADIEPADTLPATTAAPTTTRVTPSTTRPSTTRPSTTRPSTTRPSTTVGLTTVVTLAAAALPVPVAPPPPRAEEPYVEVGTIEIPKIGVSKKLLEGITLNTLDLAPGHWPGTAMPGQAGNVVVAGHRTSHDKPFRYVDQLTIGDEVVFTTADGRFVYEVTGTTIVQPDAMYIIDQTATATATLFACHPPGSTRQRIVVTLALVP